MTILSLVISIVISVAILLIARGFVLWYWKIDRVVSAIEDIHELAFLVLGKDLEEKTVTVIHLTTKAEKEMTIKQYLKLPNKSLYKIK